MKSSLFEIQFKFIKKKKKEKKRKELGIKNPWKFQGQTKNIV